MSIPFHPLANLFPLIEGPEFEALCQDIDRNGLQQPVLIWRGSIIDGRNRYRALCETGRLTPELPGVLADMWRGALAKDVSDIPADQLAAYVLSLNLHRRHLDATQRAMVAAKLATKGVGRPAGEDENSANLRDFEAVEMGREEAAAALNVSPRSVDTAKQLMREAPAEVVAAAERGEVSLHRAQADVAAVRDALGKAGTPISEQAMAAAYERLRSEQAARKLAKQADKKAKRAEREANLAGKIAASNAALKAAGASGKRYGVFLADPEWRHESYSLETGMDRAAENHYPTSTTDDICARPVGDLAAPDAVLGLWAVASMLPDALRVMTAWGFTYKSHIIWDKERIGLGYWVRTRHELLLVGTRGNIPAPAMGDQVESVIRAARGRHSEKPAFAHEMFERLYPNMPKLEMNARAPREGWDLWGAEAPEAGTVKECLTVGEPVWVGVDLAAPGGDHSVEATVMVRADHFAGAGNVIGAAFAEGADAVLDAILSPAECRRRREALGLGVGAFARLASMAACTIRDFEAGRHVFRAPSWRKMLRDALARLEAAGGGE